MGAPSETASARGKGGAWPHPHGRARDAAVFASGAAAAVLVLVAAASVLAPTTTTTATGNNPAAALFRRPAAVVPAPGLATPPRNGRRTFYDDPDLSYAVVGGRRLTGWDAKRAAWLNQSRRAATEEEVVMVSGSQPGPCAGAGGDHLLLRFLKNKLDYCRLHGIQLLYNRAHLEPTMPGYWAKLPVLRAAMLAHPEAEWLWWVDVDAVVTDMDFSLPLGTRYRDHDLVLYGWPERFFKERSWLGLNAGVFLIRNCQWSLDFIDEWARMGPAYPESYARWGEVLRAQLADKDDAVACDQSALVYLLLNGWEERFEGKVLIETDYFFQAYWKEVVGRLRGVAARYEAVERAAGAALLRRRHAEREHVAYAAARNAAVRAEVPGPDGGGGGAWRRPFVTHFVGCAPCSGVRNPAYPADSCAGGMRDALDFADDQVLRAYGFRHAKPRNDGVTPLPFDYPAVRRWY